MSDVQRFDEGDASQRDLLGGKGANLAEMTRMGLPVPPGFTVTTDACRAHLAGSGDLDESLLADVDDAVRGLEEQMGRQLGDPSDPLLLSVRSGAKFSMPGMMDTILNLGLNPDTAKGLAAATGDERFAADAHRRFVEMFGRVVLGVPAEALAAARDPILVEAGVDDAALLDAARLQQLVAAELEAVTTHTGEPFPTDPREQLTRSIEAVFGSWNGRRARDYRKMEGIPDDLGTAVNVQVMVFGNAGDDCGTGVAFTRDPATGEATPYGDFLVNAQGEDVVAGVRHTLPLSEMADVFPDRHVDLLDVFERLEARYRDMCDIEFTIEHDQLYILQTRVGKRTARAAVRMAVEMADEGLIDHALALHRVTPTQLERLLHPSFATGAEFEVLTKGLAAAPGAATGRVAFTADEAALLAAAGEDVILVRTETSPEDLHGMIAARGILTSHGGLVSHAAVVARGIGTPAVCGAGEIRVEEDEGRFSVGSIVVESGDVISLDGTSGEVVVGHVDVEVPDAPPSLQRLLSWADDARRLGVRANADTADDARRAREAGAEGIGLCRTEHMFLGDRLPVVRRLLLADGDEERTAALAELHDVQREDFVGLLEAMDGLPVTVRLLDAPLHEFLPDLTELSIAEAQGLLDETALDTLHAVEDWDEVNPMLGTRGVRLGVLLPDLYRMQVRALVEAAVTRAEAGGDPRIEIMIPLVVSGPELAEAAHMAAEVVSEVVSASDVELDVPIGTMVETPRAALRAEELAEHADFFSFGTNDLTQMTFGFSRDDVEGRIMATYLRHGLLPDDPFETLDQVGVGELIRLAVERGRRGRPDISLGICGEHGGEPASIRFVHEVGLDYVSCSPMRLAIARLAAGQVATDPEGLADDR